MLGISADTLGNIIACNKSYTHKTSLPCILTDLESVLVHNLITILQVVYSYLSEFIFL